MSDDDFFIFPAVPWEAFCRICIKIIIRVEVKKYVAALYSARTVL